MIRTLLKLPLFLILLNIIAANKAVSGGIKQTISGLASSSVFGISRGGAIFGRQQKKVSTAPSPIVVTDTSDRKLYPNMSNGEIENWLSHIPIYAVTDSNGAGVVLRPDNATNVLYFFMSHQMANTTLHTLKTNNNDFDLRVSVYSLGKIWYNVLHAENSTEVMMDRPGIDYDKEAINNVDYRIVPDTRDLMGARMLLTMDPEDNEGLNRMKDISEENAHTAFQKAMTQSPRFNNTYNEIPVFMISQMCIHPEVASREDGKQLLPMYFSLQNMVETWQNCSSKSMDAKYVAPAINLIDLHELIDKMQGESEIDFRNIVLIPPKMIAPGGSDSTKILSEKAEEGGLSQLCGDTLGDL